jgi:hypothetical protein
MAAETQYTANTGMATPYQANSNLNGTGNMESVLTGAANGTLVKRITVKAQVSTTQGMIRLFIYDGSSNTRLINEIPVPAVTKSSTDNSFEYSYDCNIFLKSAYVLKASTENAESFNVIANAVDWAYYGSSVRPESANYTAKTGMALIYQANSSLDGTGNMEIVITASSGNDASGRAFKGLRIENISINALGSTSHGIVRLFIHDGASATKLITEINVPAVTQSSVVQSFSAIVDLGKFELKAGYSIKASTEKAESFAIVAEGLDWVYPA